MTLVIPPGFAEVALQFAFSGDSETMLSTFGVETTGGLTAPDLVEVGESFAGAFDDVLGSAMTLTGVLARQGVDGGDPNVVEAPLSIAFTGGDTLPPNCAFLLLKRSGLGGRKNRGRMYLPGVNDNLVETAGTLTSAGFLALSAAAADFQVYLGSPAIAPIAGMVILHDSSVGVLAPTPVTELNGSTKIATQRRRLRP